jgi:hypothetical protein
VYNEIVQKFPLNDAVERINSNRVHPSSIIEVQILVINLVLLKKVMYYIISIIICNNEICPEVIFEKVEYFYFKKYSKSKIHECEIQLTTSVVFLNNQCTRQQRMKLGAVLYTRLGWRGRGVT